MHKPVIEDLLRLVEATEAFHQSAEIRKTLQQGRVILLNLHRRLSKRRYVLALVGLSNVGKSTLLNALLGHNLAPRRNGPCTAAPIEFHYGENLQVVAYFRDIIQRPSWECSSPDDVHCVLTQLACDQGLGAPGDIRRIEVSAALPLLAQGLIVSDTPGFGAGQIGPTNGNHETALKAYLAEEVSQVLWVVRAEQGITAREMEFHDHWIEGICDEILVTGCEGWSEQDRQRFSRRFSDAFKTRLAPTFHFVSGREGLKGREANDPDMLEQAGITALERRLKSPEDRLAAMEARVKSLADDLGFWLREFRDTHGHPIDQWWHPPTWAWWLARQPESQLKDHIARAIAPSQSAHA